MYELLVEDYFAAAHSLKYYKGRCERMHGHNWKVQVYVESGKLNEIGLVIDFKEIKHVLKNTLDILDHTNLNELNDFVAEDINPTSENISKWIYLRLSKEFESKGIKVKKVRVWESRDAAAAYFE